MDKKHEKLIIGYSGFILFEQCYEYNENACYLAGSRDSISEFMIGCGFHHKKDFRIEEIKIRELINDYGCSLGEYAMEQLAFEKFKKVAEEIELEYTYEDYDADIELKVVNIY